MTFLRVFLLRLVSIFIRRRTELDREIQIHLDLLTTEHVARGMPPDEARVAASRSFGGITQTKEAYLDQRGFRSLDTLLQEIRFAIRGLRRSPGFALIAVLTLAFGIGANTAVFSALNALLLRPLPFPDGDRLMRLRQTQDRSAETNIAPVRLEDWNRLNSTFEAITGYYMDEVSDTTGDLPERIRRAFVAPRFLDVWRVAPAIGRGFTETEHRVGGPAAVLISDRYWRTRLGADPQVLKRTLRIGTGSYSIVGVMPGSFRFPDPTVDLWSPVAIDNKITQARYATWYTGVGRLRAGVTVEQARSNLTVVQVGLAAQYPTTDAKIGIEVVPLKETIVGGTRRSLWLLFGGVTLLLLITCTNIAGLLLARTSHRRHELSVRVALGASPLGVAAPLFIEAFVLSFLGALAGLAVGAAALALLRSQVAIPRVEEIVINETILSYTLATAVLVSLFCGLVPTIRAVRSRNGESLAHGTRTQVSGGHALHWLLVGAQVALAVTLLTGAGLLVRSFRELANVDAGFDFTHILTFRISGNFSETANYDRLTARIDGTIEALGTLPGVEAVATGTLLPGVPVQFESAFALLETGGAEQRMLAESLSVSPSYFRTMNIAVLDGTLCRQQPRGAMQEVMVNRTFANRYLTGWPSPIGLHFGPLDSFSGQSRIVGVVGNAREAGLDRNPVPTVYFCNSTPNPIPYFLVRTVGEPEDLAQTVRLKVKELEPLRAVYEMAPLARRIDSAYAENRLRTVLLTLFAATALALACVGLYGTLSYVVGLRRREVGLRIAVGAVRTAIVRQFLAQALRVVAVACIVGVGMSLATARLLTGMLFGVAPTDPATLSAVVAIVLTVATCAALLPAYRAARVDPMVALRCE